VREHCNLDCSRTNPLLHEEQSAKATVLREEEKRICVICAGKFSRTRTECRKVFEKRETCSRKCCDARRVAKKRAEIGEEPKTCANPDCGKPFFRRVSGKLVETKEKFKVRRTCSTKCGAAVRKSGHKWEKKRSGGGKKTPPKPKLVPEPESRAAEPVVREVWRPESWGGPRQVAV
jgi:hypothetical protein